PNGAPEGACRAAALPPRPARSRDPHAACRSHALPPLRARRAGRDRARPRRCQAPRCGRAGGGGAARGAVRRALPLRGPLRARRGAWLPRARRSLGVVPRGGTRVIDDHEHDHGHDHGGHHERPASQPELRARALEALLVERGLVSTDPIDADVSYYENDVGPQNGARVIAHAWVDPEYKARLLSDGSPANGELGFAGGEGAHMVVGDNNPS